MKNEQPNNFNLLLSLIANRSTVDSYLLLENEDFTNYIKDLIKEKFEFDEVVEKSVEWVNENY